MMMKRWISWLLIVSMLCGVAASAEEVATMTDLDDLVEEVVEEAAWEPEGYVQVRAGTMVYKDEQLTQKLGTLVAQDVIYAWTAAQSGVRNEKAAAVAFAVDGTAVYGYVPVSALSPLTAQYEPVTDAVVKGAELQNVGFVYEEKPAVQEPAQDQPADEKAEKPGTAAPVTKPEADATQTDLDTVATLTDLEEVATATDLEEEAAARDSFFTLADQIEAKAVMLRWKAVPGAKAYTVTYWVASKMKVLKTTKTEAKITGLPPLLTNFEVLPYTSTAYKTSIPEEKHDIYIRITDNWLWANAPTAVTAVLQDAADPVLTVTYTPAAEGYDGFEISDNKKNVLANVDGAPAVQKFTVANGSHTIYVRPYRYISDGSRIYGAYVKKAAKVTVKIAWMSEKTKVTGVQTGNDRVLLNWTIVPGVDGYVVNEVINKQLKQVADVSRCGHLELSGLTAGKHSWQVQPYCINSLGEKCMGTLSAALNVTLKDTWLTNAKVTVKAVQVDEDCVEITWTPVAGADGYVVSELIGKTDNVLLTAEADAVSAQVKGVAAGKHIYTVTPIQGSLRGKTYKASALTTKVIWNIAPKLTWQETSDHSIQLYINAPGVPDVFDIYVQVGKTFEKIGETVERTFMVDRSMAADLIPGKTVKLKVQPRKDGSEGKWSSVLSVKLTDAWKLVYDLQLEQDRIDRVILSWRCAGMPDVFSVYRKVGTKYVATQVKASEMMQLADGRLGYAIDNLQQDEIVDCYVIPGQFNTKGKLVNGTKSKVVTLVTGAYDACVIEDGVLIAYYGREFEVTIPEGVTVIGAGAFRNNTRLKILHLNGQVTEIGDEAFSGCTALTTVDGTQNLSKIGSKAFEGCKRLDFAFAESVAEVADNAFSGIYDDGEEWKSADLALKDTIIGFGKVEVSWVTQKNTLYQTTMDGSWSNAPVDSSTYVCESDEKQTITLQVRPCRRGTDGKMQYGTISEIKFDVDPCLYELDDVIYMLTDGELSVDTYKGHASEVYIPKTVMDYPVTRIGAGVFKNNTDLTVIELPKTIRIFGEECFMGCKNLHKMKKY